MTPYATVQDGVRKFLRLQSLPVPESQLKWTADVSDLIEALNTTKQCFADTSRMASNQMYQTSKYSQTEDVKRAMEEILLFGEDERLKALMRKKNLTMYHLVVEPMIDMFKDTNHQSAIAQTSIIIDDIIVSVLSFDDYGTEDDALVAKHQIRAMVKQREEARRVQKLAQKRGKRQKPDPVLEEPVSEDTDD